MDYQTIRTDIRPGGIGVITLNRPEKRNALSIQMRKDLSSCLREWGGRGDVGLVILTGEGTTFSAGFDLKEFGLTELRDEVFRSSSAYHRDVWNFPKPTLAAVNGPALGGGCDLATLCDIRLCSDTASFGHPEVKFGGPPLITPLRWIVGDGHARDLCLTGRTISAPDAYRMGLVSEVVPFSSLMDRALQTAASILEAPAQTLAYAKRYMIGNEGRGFEESFVIEHDRAFQEFVLKSG